MKTRDYTKKEQRNDIKFNPKERVQRRRACLDIQFNIEVIP